MTIATFIIRFGNGNHKIISVDRERKVYPYCKIRVLSAETLTFEITRVSVNPRVSLNFNKNTSNRPVSVIWDFKFQKYRICLLVVIKSRSIIVFKFAVYRFGWLFV